MDYKKLVEEKQAELRDLYDIMDTDLNLYNLEEFKLKNYEGKDEKDVDNVTLNGPQVFADKVMASIGAAAPQFEVKGKISDKQTAKIEGFIKGALALADEHLLRKMIVPMHQYLTFQACIRAWVGSRNLVLTEGDNTMFDVLPLDMRYVTYDIGPDGLLWAAYQTRRSKAQIEKEYNHVINSSYGVVTDFWNDEVNAVLVDGNVIRDVSHNLGQVPFVIRPVAFTPLITDPSGGGIEHFAKSLFSSVRKTAEDRNKFASSLNTVHMQVMKAPLTFETDQGDKLPSRSPFRRGALTAIKVGEKFALVPYRDITNAAPFFWSILDGDWQRGTLPQVDYGNLEFPLSAVAIAKLTESRDVIFLPRLQTLSLVYRDICQMLIDQFKEHGYRAELGEAGEEVEYSAKDLEGRYRIAVKFFTVSPEENITNYSVASAARGMLSDKTIRRNVLKLQDPAAEEQLLLEQEAEVVSPNVKKYRLARALLAQSKTLKSVDAEAKKVEAVLMAKEIGLTLEELEKGEISEQATEGGGAQGEAMATLPSAEVKLLGTQMRRKGLVKEPARR